MNPPTLGDDVYIARSMGLAFRIVEVRAGKRYPYVLQHPTSGERMAFSLGELAACPTEERFTITPATPVRGRKRSGCQHQWFRKNLNRHRRVQLEACAVIGCTAKRNVALLECPACSIALADVALASSLIAKRAGCRICQGDGLIPAPKECRCCGASCRTAMCGPCLGTHGYRSVVICERMTPAEERLDEVLANLQIERAHPSPEGRRKAEALG